MHVKTNTSALAVILAWASLPAWAQTITVAWRDKPPIHYSENGADKGPVLERAKKVFALAGIDARFIREPSKRIWANFQAGTTNYCSFGWYHTLKQLLLNLQMYTAVLVELAK